MSAQTQPIAGHVEAYENVLRVVLDFRTVEELRDVFGREVVQEASRQYARALAETRARRQPEIFALGWAIENAIHERMAAEGAETRQLFDDVGHRAPPPEELGQRIAELWEAGATA
jgi:hypothetical protein